MENTQNQEISPDEVISTEELFGNEYTSSYSVAAESDGNRPVDPIGDNFELADGFTETVPQILENSNSEIQTLLEQAQEQATNYEEMLESQSEDPTSNLPQEKNIQECIYSIAPSFRDKAIKIKIPQFFIELDAVPALIDENDDYSVFLEKENLLDDFDLLQQDKVIDFDSAQSATRMIDIDETHDYNLTNKSVQANLYKNREFLHRQNKKIKADLL